MRQYGLIQAFFMSFYSRKLYRDVAQNWGGFAFFYLLILLAITSIPFIYTAQVAFHSGYTEIAKELVPQLPTIKVEDGKVITPENRPYFITDPEKKENLVIIDTSGKYTTLEQARTQILVTQTEVISQKKENEIRIYKIPSNFSQVLDPVKINQLIEVWIKFAWILFFTVFLIGAYVYRILQALFYSLFGKLFSVVFNVSVTYGQIVQIALVSITPVIVLSVVLDFFAGKIPYLFLGYFILALLYLFYGILANKNAYPVIPVSNQDKLK